METLGSKLRQYEEAETHFAEVIRFPGVEISNGPEALAAMAEISGNIRSAIDTASRVTGMNAANDNISDLPGNVAGQIRRGASTAEIDEDALPSQKLGHIVLHEAWHWRNGTLSNEPIWDISIEEGLTELATSKTTGETIAYPAEIQMVRELASKVGISVSALVDHYRNGRNDIINAYIQLWHLPQAA